MKNIVNFVAIRDLIDFIERTGFKIEDNTNQFFKY